MLRYIYIVHVLISRSLVDSVDLSQALLYDKCPCLVTHTCPRHSKCYLERSIEKLSDRLNAPFTPTRRSSCRRGCENPPAASDIASPESKQMYDNIDNNPSNPTIPVKLTRSQLKQIRRAAQRMKYYPECLGRDCKSQNTQRDPYVTEIERFAVAPAFITRFVEPVSQSTPTPTSPSTTLEATTTTPTAIAISVNSTDTQRV